MTALRHAVDLLDGAAEAEPMHPFLSGSVSLTLGELAAGTQAVAAWLRGHAIAPGERMLIATSNHAHAIIAALGAARCGVIFTFLHEAVRAPGFARIVAQVEPRCVVLDAATGHLRHHLAPAARLVCAGDCRMPGATPVSRIIASAAGAQVEPVRTDPICLVYTSGSSGSPRGIMVSHANLLFSAAAIQDRLIYRRGDSVGLFLPLSFDYGLYQIFLALQGGASLYLGPTRHAAVQLVEELERERITVLPAVPSLLSALVLMLSRRPRPLRLRSITSTGEPLPISLIQRLRALLPAAEIFPMYGLSECKRVSILLPAELPARPGSVGRPLEGTSAEVVGDDGRPVPEGMPGELVVRGPHVAIGYWREPEDTAKRFVSSGNGTRALRTGDICRRDGDGFLYFEGRNDAQIKRRGFRLSTLEVESAAMALDDVAQACALVGKDGVLHLFVVAQRGELAVGSVMDALRAALEQYKVPDRVHVLPALPLSPHGKVERAQLLAAVGAGVAAQSAA